MAASINPDDLRLSWPLPPEHYHHVKPDTPPPRSPFLLPLKEDLARPGTNFVVYDMPLDQTYETDDALIQEEFPAAAALGDDPRVLVRSILATFGQLVAALGRAPEASSPLVDHIEALFTALHRAFNAMRPQEAKASLLTLMEQQVERRRHLLEQMDKRIEIAKKHLADGQDLLVQAGER